MWTFVLGTRPEAIKVAPILREFQRRGAPFRVLWTGQHATLAEGTGFLSEFEVTHLHLASANSPLDYVEHARSELHGKMRHWTPTETTGVVVQGDTASALAGARVAHDLGLPLAHVEAGLRTGDLDDPWPEEAFRTEIDQLATLHFPPTLHACGNLEREFPVKTFQPYGNTVVDALLHDGIKAQEATGPCLVTLHRRESFGQPLLDILQGVADSGIEALWPVHPNPRVREALGSLDPHITATVPAPRHLFLLTLAASPLVITDSGGVIEEACTLGIPCVIARNHTERPEAVSAGMALLAGTSPDSILDAITQAKTLPRWPCMAYGDGQTAPRITKTLLTYPHSRHQ